MIKQWWEISFMIHMEMTKIHQLKWKEMMKKYLLTSS